MDGRSTRIERGFTLGFIEGLVARRIGKHRAGINRREEESGAGEEGELAVREWQRTAHPPQCPVYCMARPVSKMHGGACDSRATVRGPAGSAVDLVEHRPADPRWPLRMGGRCCKRPFVRACHCRRCRRTGIWLGVTVNALISSIASGAQASSMRKLLRMVVSTNRI